MDLSKFNSENLFHAATDLFEQLGITLNSNTTTAMTIDSVLKEHRGKATVFDSVGDVYFLGIVKDSVFNKSPSESGYTLEAGIDEADRSYHGLMIFAVDLNKRPTRTDLSALTRAFNRISKAMPVAVLASYDVDSEAVLSLAISERFKYAQTWREGEKVGKIILLKDINTAKTHAGHERILEDLKRTTDITTYAQLHAKWLKVLDTKELNKTFFQELANWYFWAVESVEFPADDEANDEVRNATSVIRLITRLMFVWFLKEKGLVSDKLFDEKHLKAILNFKDDSSYYKAVLQNLFFATLNSDMGTRKFIAEPSGGRNSQHFVHNVFRYKREFKKPDETIKELFEPIPFLNGGLFECLDKEIEAEGGKTVRVRVDSFSDHPKNVLFVPDELFFGAEDEIDLNEIYGTKNKRYKVRGLVNILNRYKFTIAENTPLEEEIALDPELLGKVFENLLASYNPETKTTARKQTGSFYTPREIVNYMVDESLIAYLKQKLQTESEGFGYLAIGEDQATMFGNEGRIQQKLELPMMANRWNGKDEELEAALRQLFSYSDEQNPFNETETEILIKAIDNCKILDPACGSGAFPMGILHRLVHLLGKLDKDNSKWKQWQKQKAIKETERAFEIGDVKEREDRLIEINNIFEENSDDYGRKLFLIENCIYGVDIQPIAIQIAKLRFFISLIVDQKANSDAKDNLGIRPLPNLETKFVAANTLIGLEAQGGLKPSEVFDLEKQLKLVRAKHFGARTRRSKEKYRARDKEIRSQIAQFLEEAGVEPDVASRIAEWNPYDQNASAGWFDAEYMFGIEKGFDIVIGNPPYIKEATDRRAFDGVRTSKYYQGKMDLWYLFACLGLDFLRTNGGLLTFIATNNWVTNAGASKLRGKVADDSRLLNLIDFSDFKIFESASIQTNILRVRKENPPNEYHFDFRKLLTAETEIEKVLPILFRVESEQYQYLTPQFKRREMRTKTFRFADTSVNEILNKISEKGTFSIQDSELMSGIDVLQDRLSRRSRDQLGDGYAVGEGVFVLTASEVQQLGLSVYETTLLKPYFTASELRRVYGNRSNSLWIIYTDSRFRSNPKEILKFPKIKAHLDRFGEIITSEAGRYGLNRPRDEYYFKGEKIFSLRKCSRPTFAYTDYDCYVSRAFFSIKTNRVNQKLLTAVLNSSVVEFWLRNKGKMQGLQFQVDKDPILNIPICQPSGIEQRALVGYVDAIIESKKQEPDADTTKLEAEIDEIVFQIYGLTDEEIAIVKGRNV